MEIRRQWLCFELVVKFIFLLILYSLNHLLKFSLSDSFLLIILLERDRNRDIPVELLWSYKLDLLVMLLLHLYFRNIMSYYFLDFKLVIFIKNIILV